MKTTIVRFFVLLVMIGGCKDEKIVGIDPPCIDCPFDFRLTDFEPAWSPDGKTIAYVHGDTADGKTGIYLIDTFGMNKKMFYASGRAYSPA